VKLIKIPQQFQRQYLFLWVQEFNETIDNTKGLNRKCQIQEGGHKTVNNDISICRQVNNEIPTTSHLKGPILKCDKQEY